MMESLLRLVCAFVFVGWLVFDRASFEVRLGGRPTKEATRTALFIGLAASGILSVTFLIPHEVDAASWSLRVVLQFVILSLVSYAAATRGASLAASKLIRNPVQ